MQLVSILYLVYYTPAVIIPQEMSINYLQFMSKFLLRERERKGRREEEEREGEEREGEKGRKGNQDNNDIFRKLLIIYL